MLIIGLHISLHNVYKTLKNARFCSKTGLTKAVDIKKENPRKLFTYKSFFCARSGTRTRTGFSAQGILSPSCLPFHHSSSVEWKKQS